jgi:ribonuclease-3
MRTDLEKLEAALGHQFQDRDMLMRALTHSSRVHEQNAERPDSQTGPHADNEQMEFLGDAVLGFLAAETMVHRFPSYPEGRLSKLKAHLVSAAHLYKVAQELELGQYLILGRGEEMSGGRAKKTLLADCLEALIAALYLDGGMDVVRRFVNRCVIGDGAREFPHTDSRSLDHGDVNFKGALQELARMRKLPPPRYATVKEHGPEHAKTFTMEVRLGREWVGQAEGSSKKSAAQNAAREVLARLMEQSP